MTLASIFPALCLAVIARAHLTTTPPPTPTEGENTAIATVLAGSLTSGLVGSVVSANACHTTYAFMCAESADDCEGYPWTFSLTKGPSTYEITYTTSADRTQGSAYELCSMSGSTYAVCTETVVYRSDGTKTTTSVTTTVSGSELHFAQFPITAGTQKLATTTGSCSAIGNDGSPRALGEGSRAGVAPGVVMAAGAAVAGILF